MSDMRKYMIIVENAEPQRLDEGWGSFALKVGEGLKGIAGKLLGRAAPAAIVTGGVYELGSKAIDKLGDGAKTAMTWWEENMPAHSAQAIVIGSIIAAGAYAASKIYENIANGNAAMARSVAGMNDQQTMNAVSSFLQSQQVPHAQAVAANIVQSLQAQGVDQQHLSVTAMATAGAIAQEVRNPSPVPGQQSQAQPQAQQPQN